MRIMHLLATHKLSGAENVAADICMMFEGIHAMAYCSPAGQITDALAARRVPFLPLSKLTVGQVKRAIQKFQPDILHAHDVRSTVVAALTAMRVPIVSHLHVNDPRMSRVSVKSILYGLASTRSSNVIGVTPECIGDYAIQALVRNKGVVLTNVLNTERIDRLMDTVPAKPERQFVFFGRLDTQKDPLRAADIAVRVLRETLDTRFLVVGDGPYRRPMTEALNAAGLLERVEFTGNLLSPYALVAASRAMLMCSKFEGLPIAALEAMHLGVPIVSTPTDGLSSVIIDHTSGRLCETDDEFVQALKSLLDDDVHHQKLSRGARQVLDAQTDQSSYRTRLAKLYEDVVSYG